MLLIWATTEEVVAELGDLLPAGTTAAALARELDRAVRAMTASVLRWPYLDTDQRAADPVVRQHIVAAVAETVRYRLEMQAAEAALGGMAAVEVIADGGSVTAGSLTVAGGRGISQHPRLGNAAPRVPVEAWRALQAAGMVGGSGRSW